MRSVALVTGLAALSLPALAAAQTSENILAEPVLAEPTVDAPDAAKAGDSVFDGDYAVIGVGVGFAPTYEGSDNTRVLPVVGATGEVGGVGFTIRGPSISLDLLNIDLGDKATFKAGPQVRYRSNRTGDVKDEVVEALGELDGVIEAGGRVGVSVQDVFSTADSLSGGVAVRFDVSGKGSGYVVSPSASYRLPLSRSFAVGMLVSTQFVSGDYADYNYNVSPAGAVASGLPAYDAKGGFNEFTVGVGAAHDLGGDFLDGGLSVAAGVSYTTLFGSAAKTPITRLRGSRDSWMAGAGIAYTF